MHHVAKLSPDSVANHVQCLQKRLELPGLLQEWEEFMVRYEIGQPEQYSASQWKNLINNNILDKNRTEQIERGGCRGWFL